MNLMNIDENDYYIPIIVSNYCNLLIVWWVVRLVAVKPEMKFVGNMHGNEAIGRELLIRLAAFLCDQWHARTPAMVDLLNRTNIHIMVRCVD